jgi:hypothetical protein
LTDVNKPSYPLTKPSHKQIPGQTDGAEAQRQLIRTKYAASMTWRKVSLQVLEYDLSLIQPKEIVDGN